MRKKPLLKISGSTSSWTAAAIARASGYRSNSAGVSVLMILSVDWAARIVAHNSSNGLR